ncbi:hypothetical protein AGMMS49543_28340 [Betaproteobacteria bacterium]|nr:hypothetical protein AGMMS49543_28340 [Betaproteobacteria bacterium]GHU14420.1 hypothetical protein AGMMS50225_26210 [Betaproteobacteria bacterium]GHU18563.1 hypothetical protein AGMMS50243_08800 [Betaproteobacteria bacterium]
MDHHQLDQRSLAFHRLVAEKIRRDPGLFSKVLPTLQRWKGAEGCRRSLPYLMEWEQLARQGMDACLTIATEDSEHAQALRQSTPFVGILTHAERFAFLKSWKIEHDAR